MPHINLRPFYPECRPSDSADDRVSLSAHGCATVWVRFPCLRPPSSMSVPALRFQQVVKRYGPASVLHGVDLELQPGQCFGLVGVNGAGKTSLIKCLLDFCA